MLDAVANFKIRSIFSRKSKVTNSIKDSDGASIVKPTSYSLFSNNKTIINPAENKNTNEQDGDLEDINKGRFEDKEDKDSFIRISGMYKGLEIQADITKLKVESKIEKLINQRHMMMFHNIVIKSWPVPGRKTRLPIEIRVNIDKTSKNIESEFFAVQLDKKPAPFDYLVVIEEFCKLYYRKNMKNDDELFNNKVDDFTETKLYKKLRYYIRSILGNYEQEMVNVEIIEDNGKITIKGVHKDIKLRHNPSGWMDKITFKTSELSDYNQEDIKGFFDVQTFGTVHSCGMDYSELKDRIFVSKLYEKATRAGNGNDIDIFDRYQIAKKIVPVSDTDLNKNKSDKTI